MKKIPVEKLETGMVIGKTVCTGDGSVLFPPGTAIDEPIIKQLFEAGISAVEIMDGDSCTPGENQLTRTEITRTVRNIFNDITLTNPLDQGTVKQTVNDMLRQVLKNRHVLSHLTEVRGAGSYIFTHSVNVCMLSLIMGLYMDLKREQLKQLGLAALLHDIGQSKIPKNILYKPSLLLPEESEEVKRHPIYGYEMLKAYTQLPEAVRIAALQHHERLDGSGYPGQLVGDQIDFYARIVAVADVFDALLTDRPFRKAFFPHQAVDIIIGSSAHFDPEVLEVFLENVAIYPMGSVVSLNSGEIGIVVDMNKGYQTRPVVRIIYDSGHQKIQNMTEVDLSKYPDMFIAKLLREEQVEKIIG